MGSSNGAIDAARMPVRYVCMPGSPFTGSTLLGGLLDAHPQIASIGAATGLIRRVDLPNYRCSCGQRFLDCPFWGDIPAKTAALGYPVEVFRTDFWSTHLRLSHNRFINAALVRSVGWEPLNEVRDAIVGRIPPVRSAIDAMGWKTWSLASAVLQKTGKTVFVDTARDHQRPKYLVSHPQLDVKVIHLIRDPRGNAASIMKHTGLDAGTAARQWRHYNVEAARMRRHVPAGSWMALHYEALCADPKGELDRISDFLGVPRAPADGGSRNHEHHIIGNPTRLKGYGEIREDLSWQTKLGRDDLATIARIAGPTSRSLGFTWP